MAQHVLLVEPDANLSAILLRTIPEVRVNRHAQFVSARRDLESRSFDFIVANLRLGAHNGLHLVYLAAVGVNSVRSVVYTDGYDKSLAREVRRAGAFYETSQDLPCSLATYLRAALPSCDRRNACACDRRSTSRHRRRCSDQHSLLGSA